MCGGGLGISLFRIWDLNDVDSVSLPPWKGGEWAGVCKDFTLWEAEVSLGDPCMAKPDLGRNSPEHGPPPYGCERSFLGPREVVPCAHSGVCLNHLQAFLGHGPLASTPQWPEKRP